MCRCLKVNNVTNQLPVKTVQTLLIGLMLLGVAQVKAQSLTPADKIELSELVARWNLYTDTPNLAQLNEYMALWSTGNPVLKNPFGTFTGTAAIKKWQQGYNVSGGPAFGKRHSSQNVVSNGSTKNQADVLFDLYLSEVNEIPFLAATARGSVKAVKEGGAWKIQGYDISTLDPGFGKLMEKMKAAK